MFSPQISKTQLLYPKSNLDPNVLKNYRPVSNLSFISKVLERIVYSQILAHLTQNKLTETFQSAYKEKHSTESALLRVFSDLAKGIDEGNISTLALLDLSAAFDTIDHSILLKRLEISFGIKKKALNWLLTYLSNRLQTVKTENIKSSAIPIKHGVPQGSVLGPLLFTLYISPLTEEIKAHNFSYHQYADDTQ